MLVLTSITTLNFMFIVLAHYAILSKRKQSKKIIDNKNETIYTAMPTDTINET